MTKNEQAIQKAKGRPMLQWAGKKPLERIEYFPAQEKEVYGNKMSKEFNKLFWGDNLQVLAHLLKDYRGKVDLIYIDPPFDSKADYVRKVQIRGQKMSGKSQGVLEEMQYTDMWEKDEYIQFMYERLLIMRELLSETGGIFLHCDWHKSGYLRLIMDEVFGEDNFVNEIIWHYADNFQGNVKGLATNHNNILWYSKTGKYTANKLMIKLGKTIKRDKRIWSKEEKKLVAARDKDGKIIYEEFSEKKADDVWAIGQSSTTKHKSKEHLGYPTQKPEAILERLIKIASNEGDLVMDCFCGSGTTMAVAQKLGRRWLGCDINLGAIQTSVKRLSQIVQQQESGQKKMLDDFGGFYAFKVLNVNNYDIFKNELEAKSLIQDIYGIEPIKRVYFDGKLGHIFVKIMPLNRVLNKMDIKSVLESVDREIHLFTAKGQSKGNEALYEEEVLIICSGAEADVLDFLRKENKTGVDVKVRDIQTDKENLIFKKQPEAKLNVKAKGKELSVILEDFYSPILMRRLEMENQKMLKAEGNATVEDFKQIIDSVAIDVEYDGKLFNAEIMDAPQKNQIIEGQYKWTYEKGGKKRVAIKIIDVLGEGYFETFDISI